MRIKQSFCLPCFHKPDGDLPKLLREAAKIGFAACEIWYRDESIERVSALARENSLALVSMCGHRDWRNGLNGRENHERIESEIAASVEVAARLGIGNLICFSGMAPSPGTPQAGRGENSVNTVVEGFRRIVPLAERNNITLNIELLNSKVDHIGYECDRTWWAVEVCKRIGSPRLKVLYDIYHMQIMEGDVIRTIRENVQFIGHIHTAGNPGRHDLDDEQELNYRAIARAIAATDYSGYVAHEFFPKSDPIEALRRAFETCDV